MPHRIRKPGRLYLCAWCNQRKILAEMRYPDSSKGKAPSTCAACRAAHPAESWCDFHGEPHPVEKFALYWGGRPGYFNICQDARALKAARVRDKDPRACDSCGEECESWFFRGGQNKSPVCRHCEDANPGKRWCVACRDWLPESEFNRTGVDGRFWTVRCRPCRSAHGHGTTVAELLRIQGSDTPECAACGSTKDLKVDHDHDCCPTQRGCSKCVRGYLCHPCNTAEGLLRTPEQALALADYMTRIASRALQPKPQAAERSRRRDFAARPNSAAKRAAHPLQSALW